MYLLKLLTFSSIVAVCLSKPLTGRHGHIHQFHNSRSPGFPDDNTQDTVALVRRRLSEVQDLAARSSLLVEVPETELRGMLDKIKHLEGQLMDMLPQASGNGNELQQMQQETVVNSEPPQTPDPKLSTTEPVHTEADAEDSEYRADDTEASQVIGPVNMNNNAETETFQAVSPPPESGKAVDVDEQDLIGGAPAFLITPETEESRVEEPQVEEAEAKEPEAEGAEAEKPQVKEPETVSPEVPQTPNLPGAVFKESEQNLETINVTSTRTVTSTTTLSQPQTVTLTQAPEAIFAAAWLEEDDDDMETGYDEDDILTTLEPSLTEDDILTTLEPSLTEEPTTEAASPVVALEEGQGIPIPDETTSTSDQTNVEEQLAETQAPFDEVVTTPSESPLAPEAESSSADGVSSVDTTDAFDAPSGFRTITVPATSDE